jgi:hypothetical protein
MVHMVETLKAGLHLRWWPVLMEETEVADMLARGDRQIQTLRSADLHSALSERPTVMNAMEPDRSTSYQTQAQSRSQTGAPIAGRGLQPAFTLQVRLAHDTTGMAGGRPGEAV